MIIIHIAYNTFLVTNVAWHAYHVIGFIRYITELVGSHISGIWQYCGWLVRLWARSKPITGGIAPPPGQEAKTIENILY